MFKALKSTAMAAGFAAIGASSHAAPITPTFDSFGALPQATFGGSGIPNDAVSITRFTMANGDEVTLGLSATPRFSNPALSNDGAGTFTAGAGANDGIPGNAGTAATWNFSMFASIEPGTGQTTATTTFAEIGLSLYYDFDPAAGTDDAEMGFIDLAAFEQLVEPSALDGPGLFEESQNATFGYLAVDNLFFNFAPDFATFDPNAPGEYSFAMRAFDRDFAYEASMNVNVVGTSPVPLPASAFLLLGALGGLGLMRRKSA